MENSCDTKNVEDKLDTYSNNVDTCGGKTEYLAGEVKTSSFRKLLTEILPSEKAMEHVLTDTHGFLSLGTATGRDVSLASLYNPK
jgi:hypothetical protein